MAKNPTDLEMPQREFTITGGGIVVDDTRRPPVSYSSGWPFFSGINAKVATISIR